VDHQVIKANVWPWKHQYEHGGPVDITIGIRSQPRLLADWKPKNPLLCRIEQPEPNESNLSLIYILAKPKNAPWPDDETKNLKWFNCHQHRRKQGGLRVRVKTRVTNQLAAPLPIGKYEGVALEDPDGKWVLLTFQAVTLRTAAKEEPKSPIIQPGDPDFESTRIHT